MTALLSHPWLIKAAAFGAAVLMVVLFLAGMRRDAIKIGEQRERLRTTERVNNAARTRNEVQNEIRNTQPSDVDQRLRDKWTRPRR